LRAWGRSYVAGRFTEWPEEIGFKGADLDVILAGLDHAIELAAQESPAWKAARRAQMLIWRKVWPELAELYDDEPDNDEEA
jgi:hypothetical protein